MTDRLIPLAPGESVVLTGAKLSGHVNTPHDRYRVTDGSAPVPVPVPDPVPTPVPVPTPPTPIVVTSSLKGGVLTGKVPWTANLVDGVAADIGFYIDGVLKWTEAFAPYTYGGDPGGLLDTATLPDGPHDLAVLAHGVGATGLFAGGRVMVANAAPLPVPVPPPPGSTMPTTVPAGWKAILAEDFDTPLAEGQWPGVYGRDFSAYPKDWRDTARSQGRRGGLYDPHQISVANGLMRTHLQTINGVRRPAVPTLVPGGQSNWTAARIEFRFRADAVYGFKTAWLWWPGSNTWPRDGEIDFPEGDLDQTIGGFMHRQGATSGSDQAGAKSSGKRYTDWHVGILEWVGGKRCTFTLDGVVLLDETNRVPNTPMHFVFQNETSLSSEEARDGDSGYVDVDWVRFLVPG